MEPSTATIIEAVRGVEYWDATGGLAAHPIKLRGTLSGSRVPCVHVVGLCARERAAAAGCARTALWCVGRTGAHDEVGVGRARGP
jgi:hypothetical protein